MERREEIAEGELLLVPALALLRAPLLERAREDGEGEVGEERLLDPLRQGGPENVGVVKHKERCRKRSNERLSPLCTH